MICPKCGLSLPDDSEFCQYCGSVVLGEQTCHSNEVVQVEKEQYTILEEETDRILQGSVPVILERTKLLKDEEGKLFLSCQFVSVADKPISAMLVDVLCADVWRVNLQPIKGFQYLDLLSKRDIPFGEDVIIPIPDRNTRVVAVTVQKIVLADGTLFSHTEDNMRIPEGKPLTQVLNEELLEEYRRRTINRAQYVPSDLGQTWFCACGAINRRDEEKCHICGGVLSQLIEELNTDNLRKCIISTRQAQIEEEERKRAREEVVRAEREKEKQLRLEHEKQIRLQREKEAAERNLIAKESALRASAEAAEKKKRHKKTAIAVALAIVVLIAGVWAVLHSVRQSSRMPVETPFVSPANESPMEEATVELTEKERTYLEAERLEEEGKYYEAATTFYAIKDYKDSWDRCFSLWGKITERKTIYGTMGIKKDGTLSLAYSNIYWNHYEDSVLRQVITWDNLAAIACTENIWCGLRPDGTTISVSWNSKIQVLTTDWTDIVAVSAKESYVIGLRANGSVLSYLADGRDYGQCNVAGWEDIVMVSAGGFHTVGLKKDGTVVATGDNRFNQCNVQDWTDIIFVAAGPRNTVGVKSDGSVVASGDNSRKQCEVTAWTDIIAIDNDESCTIGLRADGTVVCSNLSVELYSWTDIVEISFSEYTYMGLRANGDLVSLVKDGRLWDVLDSDSKVVGDLYVPSTNH